MNDEENKVEDAVEEATQAAEKAENAAEEAQEAAAEASDAAAEAQASAEVVKDEAEVKTEEPKAEEPKKPAKEVSKKLEDIISDIEKLTVLELADFGKALEDRFGVTAAAPMAMAAAPAAGAGEASEAAEEKSSFNVILTEAGANKIGAIKAVREIVPSLGLKEAKDLVDSAPKPVLEGAGKEAANEAKAKLEAAGAKVELQ